uniref:Uncharacterized protein n=1 Tax=Hyaloperonospora arabidopsidis (strain Emoy2) TaxID=559515 RepID=M4B9I6_HYAAE
MSTLPTLRLGVVSYLHNVPRRGRVARSRCCCWLSASRRTRGLDTLPLDLRWKVHLSTLAALRVQRAVFSARHPVHTWEPLVPDWSVREKETTAE